METAQELIDNSEYELEDVIDLTITKFCKVENGRRI